MTRFLVIALVLAVVAPQLASAAPPKKFRGYQNSLAHGLPPAKRYKAKVTPTGRFNKLVIKRLRWKQTRRGLVAVGTSHVQNFAFDRQVKVGDGWVAIQWQSASDGAALGNGPELYMLEPETDGLRQLSGSNQRNTPTRDERGFFYSHTPDKVVAGPGGTKLHFYLNGSTPLQVFVTDGVTRQAGRLRPVQVISLLRTSTLEAVSR
jgi:hypothetical protein